MAGTFTLTINSNQSSTSSFGETKASERAELCQVLHQAIAAIGSGLPSSPLVDRNRNVVGGYTYGPGMLNSGA